MKKLYHLNVITDWFIKNQEYYNCSCTKTRYISNEGKLLMFNKRTVVLYRI